MDLIIFQNQVGAEAPASSQVAPPLFMGIVINVKKIVGRVLL